MIQTVREARDISQQGRRCIQDGRKEIEERGEKDDLEEREIRIEQDNGDYNIVQLFQGGFRIIESNCANQNCIHQGEVTVDNIGERLLGNEIICLPHKLVLTLETAADAAQEPTP